MLQEYITTDITDYTNKSFDLVVCFYHNTEFESYERGYKDELWFEDGSGNRIKTPKFIFNNSSSVIQAEITQVDNLFNLSDEVMEIIQYSGYDRISENLFSENDCWYVGFKLK